MPSTGKDLGVFGGKLLDLWDLTNPEFIKGLLGGFVKREFFAVGLKELFAVAGLPVGFISAPCLGVVDDVLFQSGNLRQPLFRSLDGGKQFIPSGGRN